MKNTRGPSCDPGGSFSLREALRLEGLSHELDVSIAADADDGGRGPQPELDVELVRLRQVLASPVRALVARRRRPRVGVPHALQLLRLRVDSAVEVQAVLPTTPHVAVGRPGPATRGLGRVSGVSTCVSPCSSGSRSRESARRPRSEERGATHMSGTERTSSSRVLEEWPLAL